MVLARWMRERKLCKGMGVGAMDKCERVDRLQRASDESYLSAYILHLDPTREAFGDAMRSSSITESTLLRRMTTHINQCFADTVEKKEKEKDKGKRDFDEKCIEDVFGGASSPFVWRSKLFTVNAVAAGRRE